MQGIDLHTLDSEKNTFYSGGMWKELFHSPLKSEYLMFIGRSIFL